MGPVETCTLGRSTGAQVQTRLKPLYHLHELAGSMYNGSILPATEGGKKCGRKSRWVKQQGEREVAKIQGQSRRRLGWASEHFGLGHTQSQLRVDG